MHYTTPIFSFLDFLMILALIIFSMIAGYLLAKERFFYIKSKNKKDNSFYSDHDVKEPTKTEVKTEKAYVPEKIDDLLIIEGIGPKTKEILENEGITKFSQLANIGTERIQTILNNAGPNFQIINPKTWVDQAKLASEGRFEELENLKESLTRGV